MFKTNEKNETGITLISLVVTIVVILILAGVTISTVFSENGIIAKAREAANRIDEAIAQEQAELNMLYNDLASAINNTTSEEPADPTPTLPEGWDGDKVTAVESEDEIPVTVPVPIGYTASSIAGENTVEGGFVIYEGTEAVNDTNKDTAREERNQFVWVPVSNINEMYGTDSSGKKWGKLYDFSETEITARNWTEEDGVMNIIYTSGVQGHVSNREPDVVSYDSDSTISGMGIEGVTTKALFEEYIETEFSNMIESVETYGGFYIGRYETGSISEVKAKVVKNNLDINNQTWYIHYQKSKGIAVNGNVESTMIWGCQWDAVMRWMYNSGDEEKKTYTYDSTGKGNFPGTQGNEEQKIPTGSNEAYAINNIYDMAGNVWDWTMEAVSYSSRTMRGCSYYDSMSDYYSSRRGSDYPTSYLDRDGSRVSLYIKI